VFGLGVGGKGKKEGKKSTKWGFWIEGKWYESL